MDLPIESIRLKQVRDQLGLTQAIFGQQLGLSTTADMERGRTKVSGLVVMKLLRDYQVNPLWLYGESKQQRLNPNEQDVIPKTITVDNLGSENILLVNQKAAAGYADNIGDPEYYKELPAFGLPLPEYRNASYRGFQVEGYSMMPAIQPDEWIITKAIANTSEVRNGGIYVVVESESIRIKKLINNKDKQSLTLISLNPDYPTDEVAYDEVKELWEFHSKLTQELALQSQNSKLDAIHADVKKLGEMMGGM